MKCVCDRCGIKFDHYYVTGSNYALSFPEVRVLAQGDGDSHCVVENIFDLYQDWGINLCPDCSEKFMDWMHNSRNDADILLQDAKNDLRVAEERIENLEADVNRLHSDIFELSRENDKLEDDNEQLGFLNSNLIKDNEALDKENSYLKKEIHQLSWEKWMCDHKDPNKEKIQEAFDRFDDALFGDGDGDEHEIAKKFSTFDPNGPLHYADINIKCRRNSTNCHSKYPKRKGKTRNKRSH